MHVLYLMEIGIGGFIFFLILWAVLEAPGNAMRKNQPIYWKCSANHRNLTPDAARKCSAKQPR
jgi:hypothetical protein